MRRVVVAGGELELARLLDLFPAGVEETAGGFAVYTDEAGERTLRGCFSIASEPVADGWEDRWREFHHGVVVGRLWVGPPWEEPPRGVEAIVIDPGRAFGTGAHPTTRLSLELLQELEPADLLDVGCGSGILAIAAARLGFRPVAAVDVDDVAVETTRSNARVNGVALSVEYADAVRDELPAARVALANIALAVVERVAPRLRADVLVASGYLERGEPILPGWVRGERRVAGGWAADLFVREGSFVC